MTTKAAYVGAVLVCLLAGTPGAGAQTAQIRQTSLNRVESRLATVYALDFEGSAADVITLAPQVSVSTASGDVVSGSKSLKFVGGAAYAQLRPQSLNLQPLGSYTLTLKYRFQRAGRFGVVLRSPGAGALEFIALGELGAGDTASWDIEVPGVTGATILFYALDATATIDDIVIASRGARVTRAELPLLTAGFPRLANYMLVSPALIAGLHGVDPADAEQVTSRYDVLFGSGLEYTQGAGTWVRRLQQLNPSLRVLPYRQSYMAQFDGSTGLQAQFTAGLDARWFMRSPSGNWLPEPSFPQNVQLDHTSFAPAVGGETLADYSTRFLSTKVLSTGLWDGILFDQPEWYVNPLLGTPAPPIDINRDGTADSLGTLQAAWANGFKTFFQTVTRQLGFTQLLVGNAGYIPANPTALKALNGWVAERPEPYPAGPAGEWLTNGASGWYRLLNNYLLAGTRARAPQLPVLEFSGIGLGAPTGTFTPNGLPMRSQALGTADFRRMRLGLTTALLGNGFFEYDLVDNTTPSLWFDEYAVDALGTATTDLSGKGYLGQPLEDAIELPYAGTTIFSLNFESAPPAGVFVGPGRFTTTPAEVIAGTTSLVITKMTADDFAWFVWASGQIVPGRTYQLRADYRILTSTPVVHRGLLGLGFMDPGGGLSLDRTGSLFMQDDGGPGQQGTLRAAIKAAWSGEQVLGMLFDVGSVSVDNVRLVEGVGGVWRRDFENGIVLVNPTPDTIVLTQVQVAGARGRTRIRRIQGWQVPQLNNGSLVTAGISIAPGDGIVLLADRVAAAAITAPTNLAAVPAGTSANLSWKAGSGYAAGYEIRYGEYPDALVRVAGAGPIPSVTIEDLQAGATYYIRVRAFDFLGRLGPVSALLTMTVPGTLPARPTFAVAGAGTLAPGTLATLTGTMLSDLSRTFSAPYPTRSGDTRVEVNGIEAPLSAVSPTSISFFTPFEIGGPDAVVNVFRGASAARERLVPVLAAP